MIPHFWHSFATFKTDLFVFNLPGKLVKKNLPTNVSFEENTYARQTNNTNTLLNSLVFQAAITKHRRPNGLNNRYGLSLTSEGWKSEMKVLAWLDPS